MNVADGMQDGQSVVAGAGEDAVAEAMAELGAAVEGVCACWRGRTDDSLRATLGEVVPGMVRGMVAGVAAEAEAVRHGDGSAVARAAQRAVQPVGAAFIQGAWRFQGHAAPLPPEQRPCCASCGRRMKLVREHQSRHLLGRCGPYTLERSYYTCGDCGGGCSPADVAWALGTSTLDPDLQALVARDGVDRAFDAAAVDAVGAHLQVRLDDNTVHRTTVGIGLVALAQSAARAAAGTCRLGPDPGSDTLVLEVDGGRVEAGREWREAKVAAAGPLGPALDVDKDTGRAHLRCGPLRYAADIADADQFFQRQVRQLAEDAGLYHPRVRRVVLLADGGEWIEKRWASLDCPARVEVIDILDLRHFQEHVWGAAKASWGQNSPRTRAWARQQIDAVLQSGPNPLIETLSHLRPRRAEGRQAMRRLKTYVTENAHRLRYPEFMAAQLPIGSGAIEAGVRIVNNERLKNCCMHWSVAGARAVLTLRALALSAGQSWDTFWATQPQISRPPVRELAPLRRRNVA